MTGRRRHGVVQAGALVLLSVLIGACSSESSTSAAQSLVVTSSSATTTTTPPPPDTAKVPDIVGLSQTKATSRLKGLGFVVTVNKVFSAGPTGQVISSSPNADSKKVVGTAVLITVAKPIPKVPNVVGLSTAAALKKLKATGYKVIVKKQVSSQPTGHVISTNPSPGTPRLPDKSVVITVAKPLPTPIGGGGGSGSCDPNYSGCVPIASDVDCAGGSGDGPAYVSGPVQVIGSDIYGLDSDNDGVGCE